MVQSQLRGAVRTAFRALGDVKVPVVFHSKSSGVFDFSTLQGTHSVSSVSANCVVTRKDLIEPLSIRPAIKVIVNKEDIPSLHLYDTVVFDGAEYSIGPTLRDNGYVWIFQAFGKGV